MRQRLSQFFRRFRNLLTWHGKWALILDEVNRQLQRAGLQVCPSKGAVLEATLIQSAARPKKKMEGETFTNEQGEEEVVFDPAIKLSADPDATWVKKGNKSHFGYKGFVVVDASQGAIHRVHVTPAHTSEMHQVEAALGDLKPARLYADKGSASSENRRILQGRGIRNGIMYKAARNRPLSLWAKRANKLISKVRYLVEQAFGTLKRRFGFVRAAYRTAAKVEAQMILKSARS